MTDRITLAGMRFFAYHGVLPEERRRGQEFLVDVEMAVDLRAAGRSDDPAQTVDYRRAYEAAKAVLEGPPRQLLETLAEEIAERLLALDRVEAVTVRLRKPSVRLAGPVAFSAVEITRRR
ncbi:MAG: dihydroneopterin aldolase [Armatimonadota bacterium]|nr:dihydroneopterin aldolase [Armatimonadota bacterium]MDR7451614.1 dihydroneopterin aldolase [Armatimonadota bacterium]MDR7467666.1 dihydroneopterin aldolase [Armatimonadota bacterium]MDR7492583.1 dihydroneopterin aldolase [Armatimonadota bacterium]MDR7499949.1 dihydroneopterin aldolase [Armatimonadota bacterium]